MHHGTNEVVWEAREMLGSDWEKHFLQSNGTYLFVNLRTGATTTDNPFLSTVDLDAISIPNEPETPQDPDSPKTAGSKSSDQPDGSMKPSPSMRGLGERAPDAVKEAWSLGTLGVAAGERGREPDRDDSRGRSLGRTGLDERPPRGEEVGR